jgi:cyclophilin family peptidyl-prolyl cis-trans isomerase
MRAEILFTIIVIVCFDTTIYSYKLHAFRKAIASSIVGVTVLTSGGGAYCNHAIAATPPASTSPTQENAAVTAKAYVDVSIARKPAERITLGLYGDEAPRATKIFLSICKNEYQDDLNYDGSTISRVQKDKRIDFGKMSAGKDQRQETYVNPSGKASIRNVDLAEKVTHSDTNAFLHDTKGTLSVPKGGKSFQFTLTPESKPNKDLDRDNLVIGKVLDGMDVVNRINAVPVSREDALGTKRGFADAGKGFDPRAKIISLDRPLQKIVVTKCTVDESATLSSFLKF